MPKSVVRGHSRTNNHYIALFSSLILILLFFSPIAFAVNQLLALHGRANSSGTPTTSANLRVFIYDNNVNGVLVYDSNNDFNNSIAQGSFDIILGSGSINLDLNYGQRYFLDLRANDQDLNFGDFNMREFEASHGSVRSSSITDATIVNADIASTAAIAWTKISKTGSDLNELKWGSDFNTHYARKTSDDNVTGLWNFNGRTTWGSGFGSGGVTIQNGVVYTQSMVILTDLNAATVTHIDVNGNYSPDPDNTWLLGAPARRWLRINTVDFNAVTGSIGSLTLASAPVSTTPANRLNVVGDLNVLPSLTSSVPALFVATDSNVGIGTGAPAGLLHLSNLSGSALTPFRIDANSLNSSYRFVVKNDGNIGIQISDPRNALNIVGDLNILTSATAAPSLFVSAADGNIGIATGSPTGRLTIGSGQVVLPASSAGNPSVVFSGDLDTGFWSPAANTLAFSTNASERLRVASDGNVSVGSTVNGGRLFVVGDFNVANTVTSTPTLFVSAGNNRVGIGTYAPANALNVVGDLNVTGTSYLGNVILQVSDVNTNTITSRDANIVFRDSALEEIMRVVGDTNRVGIGTTNPLQTLHVVGDLNVTGVSYLGNVRFTTDDINVTNVNARTAQIAFNSATGVERMRIASDGNLGVGVAVPTQLLDVNGTARLRGTQDQNGLVVWVDGNVGVGTLFPVARLQVTVPSGQPVIITDTDNNGSAKQAVLATRNFVNAEEPLLLLYARADANTATNSGNTISIGGNDRSLPYNTANLIKFFTAPSDTNTIGGTERLRIASDGNVGIGTGANVVPNKLSVIGDVNVTPAGTGAPALFVRYGDGNVGLGTASPTSTYRLDVSGYTRIGGNLLVTGVTTLQGTTNLLLPAYNVTADGNATFGAGTYLFPSNLVVRSDLNAYASLNANTVRSFDNNALSLQTLNTTRVTIAAADGNVSIGSAVNAGRLFVAGDFNVANAATSTPTLFVSAGNNRVGIGTYAPQNLLNVVGDLNVTGTSYIGTIGSAINTSSSAIFRGDLNAYGGLNANTIRSFDNNTLSLQTLNTTRITILSDGNVGVNETTPDVRLHVTAASGDANVLRVDSSSGAGLFVVRGDGNVGVGTAVPVSKLHITVDANQGVIVTDSDANGAVKDAVIATRNFVNAEEPVLLVYGRTDANTSTSVGNLLSFGGTDQGLRFNAANVISFFTAPSDTNTIGGTERLRIAADGNVGIGTTTPAVRLQVQAASGDANVFRVDSSSGAGLFVVRGDGNVGVGTAVPVSKLHITVDANQGIIVTDSDANGAVKDAVIATRNFVNAEEPVLLVYGRTDANTSTSVGNLLSFGGTDQGLRFNAANVISFFTAPSDTNTIGGTERLRIAADGNVGIGTTTPAVRLQVQAASGDANVFRVDNSSGGVLVQVKSSGDVGVGTAAPTAKFDVAGDVNLSSTTPRLGIGASTYIQRNSDGHLIISD